MSLTTPELSLRSPLCEKQQSQVFRGSAPEGGHQHERKSRTDLVFCQREDSFFSENRSPFSFVFVRSKYPIPRSSLAPAAPSFACSVFRGFPFAARVFSAAALSRGPPPFCCVLEVFGFLSTSRTFAYMFLPRARNGVVHTP